MATQFDEKEYLAIRKKALRKAITKEKLHQKHAITGKPALKAKTLKTAETYAKETLEIPYVNYSDFSIGQANAINAKLHKHLKEFPALAGAIPAVTSDKDKKAAHIARSKKSNGAVKDEIRGFMPVLVFSGKEQDGEIDMIIAAEIGRCADSIKGISNKYRGLAIAAAKAAATAKVTAENREETAEAKAKRETEEYTGKKSGEEAEKKADGEEKQSADRQAADEAAEAAALAEELAAIAELELIAAAELEKEKELEQAKEREKEAEALREILYGDNSNEYSASNFAALAAPAEMLAEAAIPAILGAVSAVAGVAATGIANGVAAATNAGAAAATNAGAAAGTANAAMASAGIVTGNVAAKVAAIEARVAGNTKKVAGTSATESETEAAGMKKRVGYADITPADSPSPRAERRAVPRDTVKEREPLHKAMETPVLSFGKSM